MTIRNSVVRKWAHQYRPGLLVSAPPVAPSYNHFAPEAVIAFRPAITINRLYFVDDAKVQPCQMPLLVGQQKRDLRTLQFDPVLNRAKREVA